MTEYCIESPRMMTHLTIHYPARCPSIASFQETAVYLQAHYPGVDPFIRKGICFYTFDERRSIFELLLGAQIIVAIASEAFCFILAHRMFNVLRKRSNVLSKKTYRQQNQFNVMLLCDVCATADCAAA